MKLGSLQAGRAIAALLVVLYHTDMSLGVNYKLSFLGGIFGFGFSGVDFFFLLSGFIITYSCASLIGQRNRIPEFVAKRAVRIFPIYWIYYLGIVALFILMPQVVMNKDAFAWNEMMKSWFLIFGHKEVLTVSWSLSHEVYFYILFGLLIALPFMMRPVLGIILTVSLIHFIGKVSGVYELFVDDSLPGYVFSVFNLEFGLGVLAYYIFKRVSARMAMLAFWVGVILYIGFGLLCSAGQISGMRHHLRILIFGVPSFLVITGMARMEMLGRMRVPAWLILLGDASYTLYLVHRPFIQALNTLVLKKLNLESMAQPLNIAFVLMACGVSIVLFLYLEKPIVTKLNRLLKKPAPSLATEATVNQSN